MRLLSSELGKITLKKAERNHWVGEWGGVTLCQVGRSGGVDLRLRRRREGSLDFRPRALTQAHIIEIEQGADAVVR